MEEVVRRVRIDVTSNANQANRGLQGLRDTLGGLSGRYSAASRGANSHSSALKAVAKATNIATNQNNKYMSTLKRVVMYRAIRYALKAIINGFKEGLENAYFFSKGIHGDLAAALDLMAVKAQTMKNQLGAAFGSLLQTIQPIILTIISLVTKLAEALTMLFSIFGGKGTYLKAVDASAAFKKNTAGGAAAAKKMKDYLMGIDELNVIKKPDDTGGGGGGGAAASWSSMFTEAELPEWAGNLKGLLELGEFREAGAFLADHLNGIIENWDAEAAGKKIGEKVGKAFEFAFGFMYGGYNTTGFDFANLGKKLTEFVGGFFSEIDPNVIGALLVAKLNAILGLMKGWLEAFDPVATGEYLSGILMGAVDFINWEEAGQTISNSIKELVESLAEFVKKADWEQVGRDISDFIRGLNWSGLLDALVDLVAASIVGLAGLIKGLLEEPWKEICEWWNTTAYEDGKFAPDKLLEGILEGFSHIGEWFQEHLQQKIIDAINKAFGIDSETAKQMKEEGKLLPGELMAGIKIWDPASFGDPLGLVSKIISLIKGDISPDISKFWEIGKDIIGYIKEGITKFFTSLNPFKGTASKIKSSIGEDITDNKAKIENLGDQTIKLIKSGMIALKTPFSGIGLKFAEWLKPEESESEKIKDTGKGIIGKLWDGIKSKWSEVRSWLKNNVFNIFSKNKNEDNSEVMDALAEEVAEPVTFAIDINGVITAATDAGKQANEAFSTAFYANDSGGLFAELTTQFTTAGETLKTTNSGVLTELETAFSTTVTNITTAIETFLKNATTKIDEFKKHLDAQLSAVVTAMQTAAGDIEVAVTDMLQNIWDYYDLVSTSVSEDYSDMMEVANTEARLFVPLQGHQRE